VQALNKPTNTNTRTLCGAWRMPMAMAVFLGGRLTLLDQMESNVNMEYAVYSIVIVAFVFFFVFDDTNTFVSMPITRCCCYEIMHTTQTNTQYHESTKRRVLCI
jgi:hypothetical protein